MPFRRRFEDSDNEPTQLINVALWPDQNDKRPWCGVCVGHMKQRMVLKGSGETQYWECKTCWHRVSLLDIKNEFANQKNRLEQKYCLEMDTGE